MYDSLQYVVIYYDKFKSVKTLIIISPTPINYIHIKKKISSNYKDIITINTNCWGISLHGKPICQTLLESTAYYTGSEDGKSHPSVWIKEQPGGGKAAVRTGPE